MTSTQKKYFFSAFLDVGCFILKVQLGHHSYEWKNVAPVDKLLKNGSKTRKTVTNLPFLCGFFINEIFTQKDSCFKIFSELTKVYFCLFEGGITHLRYKAYLPYDNIKYIICM